MRGSLVMNAALLMLVSAAWIGADEVKTDAAKEMAALHGSWRILSGEADGQPIAADNPLSNISLYFTRDSMQVTIANVNVITGVIKLDVDATPKRFDYIISDSEGEKTIRAIYEVDEENLRICSAGPDRERPGEFATEPESGHSLFRFELIPTTPEQRYRAAIRQMTRTPTPEMRFQTLGTAAKYAFELKQLEDSAKHAEELLSLSAQFKDDSGYGTAIQDGNIVIGRIALQKGDLAEAKRRLGEAGRGPGSDVIAAYGPDLQLAKELLERGERSAVVDYLRLIANFWKPEDGRLDRWVEELQSGKTPELSAAGK